LAAVGRWSIRLVVAVAGCAAAVGISPAAGAPVTCQKLNETSLHWDAVFGHVSSLSEAIVLRQKVARYGFKNIQLEKDWCDDVEVSIAGFDKPTVRKAFFDEAFSAGFPVSFEPPYTYRKKARGYVNALFAISPTLKRANEFQIALARKGFREGTDIVRVSATEWHVVLYKVPVGVQAKFAAQARAAGFRVLRFEP
jgi:hypothetical protein